MGKILRCLIFIIVFAILFYIPVFAENDSDEVNNYNEIYDEQKELSGADGLYYYVDEETTDFMKEHGVDSLDAEKIIGFDFFDFLKSVWDTALSVFTAPFALLASILGVMLLCSLISAIKATDNENSLSTVFSLVSTLAVCGIAVAPIVKCIISTSETIKSAGNFMLAFIPVFTGIVTTQGKPVTGIVYHTSLFTLIQIIMRIAGVFLIPLLGIYLALSITGSLGGKMNLTSVSSMIKKTLLWTLGILLTIFIGLFMVQTFVSSSADNVATRTAKFMVSGFIPIVGGAISEALNTINGCLGLLKSTVGAFGIIAVLFTMLPSIISVILYKTALSIGAAAGEMLAIEKIPGLLKSINDALSILLGMLVFTTVLLIASTSIIIAISN